MTDPHFCRFCSFQMRRKTMLLFDPLVKSANVSDGQILFLLRPLPRCGPWAPVLSRAPGDTLRVPRSPSPFPPNSRGFKEEPEESLGTPSRALRGICRQVSRKKCCSCRKGSCNFKDDPPNVEELLSLAALAPGDHGATTESDEESDDEKRVPWDAQSQGPQEENRPDPQLSGFQQAVPTRFVLPLPALPAFPPSPPSTRRVVRRRTAAQITAPPPPAPATPSTAVAPPPPSPSRQLSPETLGIINLLSFTSDEGMREYLRQRLTKKGVLTDLKGPSGSGSGSG
ncbi:hypothetical protein DB88DRAFT_511555 [Papiliotrema laurentii]|uniref:Uncharacterized protein n=1 Tax=Papiliotrema laurentii TaxID=5418 RepID=A0AAD9CVZ8_PAPLA|nr:hypothetical protein DB88DRAFT_511555 [Papiliotrema laurentii]